VSALAITTPDMQIFAPAARISKPMVSTENPIFYKSKSSGHHPPICNTTFAVLVPAANPLHT